MSKDTMPVYVPRSILLLQDELSKCRDVRLIPILRAKYACALATNSDIESARSLIQELRTANRGFEPRLSAWLMYCDGILIHSEAFDCRAALDRLKRGYLFGSAVKDQELAANSAAWMAHCYFSLGEIERAVEQLKLAFDWAGSNEHTALSRAMLVVADSYSWAGDELASRRWYQRARSSAAACGDISMQNSAIYNSAAFRVSNLSLSQCEGKATALMAKLAETEVNSAATLNTLLSNRNAPSLVPLLKAELFTALGLWGEANQLFQEYFSFEANHELTRYQPKLLAEHAYCNAKIGSFEQARIGQKSAIENVGSCQDLDDTAILLFRCSQVASELGDRSASDSLHEEALFSLAQFRIQQDNAMQLISQLETKLPDKTSP